MAAANWPEWWSGSQRTLTKASTRSSMIYRNKYYFQLSIKYLLTFVVFNVARCILPGEREHERTPKEFSC